MAQDSDQDAYTQEQNQVCHHHEIHQSPLNIFLKLLDDISLFYQIVNPDGSYSFVWATSNGIRHQEVGEGGIYAEGAFNYVGSDGVPVDIQYTADENVSGG